MQRTALSALLLLLAASAAQAEVYKWVDANGNAHYTDKPPANQKTQTVDIRTQPPGTPPAAAPAKMHLVEIRFGRRTAVDTVPGDQATSGRRCSMKAFGIETEQPDWSCACGHPGSGSVGG